MGYKVADWGLWGIGLLGDGMTIAGILTANPVLAAGGRAISIGATAGSAALHAAGGDGVGLLGDGIGLGASVIPGGGNAWRKVGGAWADAQVNSAGRYVTNHLARRKAQDTLIKNAQGRSASFGAAHVTQSLPGGC